MRTVILTLALLLLSSLDLSYASALERPSSPGQTRPRIALVLAGGGYLGWAHVGVIQWLEENRIPIDAVTGSSAGGLVGAMYATGISPQEMLEFGREFDWVNAFNTEPPHRNLSFRRKEDRIQFPGKIEFGLTDQARFPSGLTGIPYIALLLSRVAMAHDISRSFDQLPVPLRAVTVDLMQGSEYVPDRGSLYTALRATMAIPGVFTPVVSDGRVLVDGGLLNVLPVSIALDPNQLGADRVIAVNIQMEPEQSGYRPQTYSEDQMSGMVAVLLRSVAVVGKRDALEAEKLARSLGENGVVLRPDLTGVTPQEWSNCDGFFQAGYQTAEQNRDALLRFQLSVEDWEEHLLSKPKLQRSVTPERIDVMVLGGEGPRARRTGKTIAARLAPFRGRLLELESLTRANENLILFEESLTRLLGDGAVESMAYEVDRSEGYDVLRVLAYMKSHGQDNVVNPSPQLVVGENEVAFNARARLTRFSVGQDGAEVRLEAGIGATNELALEYYRPFLRRGFFFAPRVGAWRTTQDYFSQGDRITRARVGQVAVAFDAGFSTNQLTEIRVGYELGWRRVNALIGASPQLPTYSGVQDNAYIRFVYDDTDRAMIPTQGLRVRGRLGYVFRTASRGLPGGLTDYPQAEGNLSYFLPLNSQESVFLVTGGGTLFGKIDRYAAFSMEGPLRLSAMSWNQYGGGTFRYVSAGYMRETSRLPDALGGRMRIGAWLEHGTVWRAGQEDQSLTALTGGFLGETLFGPVFVGGSLVDKSEYRTYITLGRLF